MGSYKIRWQKSALKALYKIDSRYVPTIISAIESLPENPFPTGYKKLAGSEFSFRIRIGNYRVVYELFNNELIIEIVRVAHRKDVYR